MNRGRLGLYLIVVGVILAGGAFLSAFNFGESAHDRRIHTDVNDIAVSSCENERANGLNGGVACSDLAHLQDEQDNEADVTAANRHEAELAGVAVLVIGLF